ncbi:hypothetical protein [Azospirillum argentinense]
MSDRVNDERVQAGHGSTMVFRSAEVFRSADDPLRGLVHR